MGKLKHSVILRESLASSPVGFPAGEELPDWAWEQVKGKAHLHETPVKDVQPVVIPAPKDQDPETDYDSAETTESDKILPKIDVVEEDDEEDLEAPPRKASKARWLAFAKEAQEEGFPVQLTGSEDRDGVIDACIEAGAVEYADEPKK